MVLVDLVVQTFMRAHGRYINTEPHPYVVVERLSIHSYTDD
jgi:hypothetical protein